jgi:ABC-type phosphate transport system substrate-binding protein
MRNEMPNTKLSQQASVSALALVLGAAGAAQAQTVTPPTLPATVAEQIFGGGSTLVQPYLRQAEDCFGAQAPTWDKSNPPGATNEPAFNFTGTPAQDCAATQPDPNLKLQYQGAGSGGGILGLFTHDPHNFASVGNFTSGGVGVYWPSVHYAASDLPLGASDVDVYNNGGTLIPTPAKTTDIQGPNNPSGAIANPRANYGALVQYPLLIAPVTFAFSPIYKQVFNPSTGAITSYKFPLSTMSVKVGNVSKTVPKLKLTAQVYCEMFNGIITDWNDPRIGALNSYVAKSNLNIGGVVHPKGSTVTTLEAVGDPTPAASFSVPIELVGRSDSSGTTGIFTRHLEAECPKVLAAGESNTIVTGPTLPSARIGGGGNPSGPGTGFFTVENGSDAVAAYLKFIAPTAGSPVSISGRIGYIGPDYVIPYNTTGTNLYAASLQNIHDSLATGVNVYILPSPAAALKSFGAAIPPESNTSGGYVPGTGSAPRRSQPDAWVAPLAPTTPIALAGETIKGSYPIVGTTNVLTYTCYSDNAGTGSVNNRGVQLVQFLNWYDLSGTVIANSATAPGILSVRGFGVLPASWRTAIKQTFLVPTTSGAHPTNALRLWISSKSDVGTSFKHDPVCDSVVGAG